MPAVRRPSQVRADETSWWCVSVVGRRRHRSSFARPIVNAPAEAITTDVVPRQVDRLLEATYVGETERGLRREQSSLRRGELFVIKHAGVTQPREPHEFVADRARRRSAL